MAYVRIPSQPQPTTPQSETWVPELLQDTTNNDSDKTLSLSSSFENRFFSAYVSFTTSATIGTRQIVIECSSAGSLLWKAEPEATQEAGATRIYEFAINLPTTAGFAGSGSNISRTTVPSADLPTSSTIRIYDVNAVDAAGDDLSIKLLYATRQFV